MKSDTTQEAPRETKTIQRLRKRALFRASFAELTRRMREMIFEYGASPRELKDAASLACFEHQWLSYKASQKVDITSATADELLELMELKRKARGKSVEVDRVEFDEDDGEDGECTG